MSNRQTRALRTQDLRNYNYISNPIFLEKLVTAPVHPLLAVEADPNIDSDSNEEEEYDVKKILGVGRCIDSLKIYYLICWDGFPSSATSWEPEENLEGCLEPKWEFNADIKTTVEDNPAQASYASWQGVRLPVCIEDEHELTRIRNEGFAIAWQYILSHKPKKRKIPQRNRILKQSKEQQSKDDILGTVSPQPPKKRIQRGRKGRWTEPPFKCTVCNRKLATKSGLQRHVSSFHPKNVNAGPSKRIVKTLKRGKVSGCAEKSSDQLQVQQSKTCSETTNNSNKEMSANIGLARTEFTSCIDIPPEVPEEVRKILRGAEARALQLGNNNPIAQLEILRFAYRFHNLIAAAVRCHSNIEPAPVPLKSPLQINSSDPGGKPAQPISLHSTLIPLEPGSNSDRINQTVFSTPLPLPPAIISDCNIEVTATTQSKVISTYTEQNNSSDGSLLALTESGEESKTQTDYMCNICKTVFTRGFALKRHVKNAHGKKTESACKACGKTFKTDEVLKGHLNSCGKDKIKCPTCGVLYTVRSFKKHKMKCHKK